MQSDNKAMVIAINEAINRGDGDFVIEAAHPQMKMTMLGFATWTGKKEVAEAWHEMMERTPPDQRPEVTINRITEQGSHVLAEGISEGQDAEGNPIRHAFADHYEFADGKVIGLTSYMVGSSPQPQMAQSDDQTYQQQ